MSRAFSSETGLGRLFIRTALIVAHSRWSSPFLFLLAACEAVFFPLPLEPFLLPLLVGAPTRWRRIVAVAIGGSITGAVLGYFLGLYLYDVVVVPLIAALSLQASADIFAGWYAEHGWLALAIGGLSPLPFKLVVLASAGLGLPFWLFVPVVLITRTLRYALFGWVVVRFGPQLFSYFDRWLIWLSLLVIAGLALWLLLR